MKSDKRRILLNYSMSVFLLIFSGNSHALSYQEKKDHDALGVMERSFKHAPMQTRLFDGERIPSDANPTEVRLHLDQV